MIVSEKARRLLAIALNGNYDAADTLLNVIETATQQMTRVNSYSKIRTEDSEDTEYTAGETTDVEPSGEGIIDTIAANGLSYNGIIVTPFGVGSDTDTFLMRIYGWRRFETIWIRSIICEVTCTLASALTGVDGTGIPSTSYFCSTITPVSGNQNVSYEIVSADDGETIGMVKADMAGSEKIQIVFKNVQSDSANALYALI